MRRRSIAAAWKLPAAAGVKAPQQENLRKHHKSKELLAGAAAHHCEGA
jgi:hypothetical protein